MYICICICILCICIYMYMYTYICIYTYMYPCTYTYMICVYVLHHLTRLEFTALKSCFGAGCMWSPQLLLDLFREVRFAWAPNHSHSCSCTVSTLFLSAIVSCFLGFWFGVICTSLVLSANLRRFLWQLLRLGLWTVQPFGPQEPAAPGDLRRRLRQYRA